MTLERGDRVQIYVDEDRSWWERFTVRKCRDPGQRCYRKRCPRPGGRIEPGELYAVNDHPENQGPGWYNKTRCRGCAEEFLHHVLVPGEDY